MTNEMYAVSGEHPRPFIFVIKTRSKGTAYILGVDHTKDPTHRDLDSIRFWWNKAQPTVAMVEGRLGFLFSWLQNPVEKFGENGLTAQLAKRNSVKLYTWEPDKDNQINIMIEKYDPAKVALLFSIRPYFSNFRYGKPANPEKQMDEYIQSRTDHPKLKGFITNWQQIDSIWKADFPNEKDWRDFSDEWGWPEGYLAEMASFNNMIRDIHLCNAVIDLVQKGETVFITMGSSHAVRIQKALETTLSN
ncbi:MAG: hypothetical protein SFU99_13795 [Saprospiraceae bacterium]|nr:hypothetical protein [Saprospiraceae bacterium]